MQGALKKGMSFIVYFSKKDSTGGNSTSSLVLNQFSPEIGKKLDKIRYNVSGNTDIGRTTFFRNFNHII